MGATVLTEKQEKTVTSYAVYLPKITQMPARFGNVARLVMKEPVGPVAAFTPWNFPINQAVRKISVALAAGCSIIVKGPEETPASCMLLIY